MNYLFAFPPSCHFAYFCPGILTIAMENASLAGLSEKQPQRVVNWKRDWAAPEVVYLEGKEWPLPLGNL